METSEGHNVNVGQWGEVFAQNLLERRGYRIVDVNVRFGPKETSGRKGEIDIVAWDGPTLCFVEVKTRQGGKTRFPVRLSPRQNKSKSRALPCCTRLQTIY